MFCEYPVHSLNYDDLKLQRFTSGAMVRTEGGFHLVADPFRNPIQSLSGALSPVGSLMDKLKVALLRNRLIGKSVEEIFSEPEERLTTYLLNTGGFSQNMIDRFFRPFYQGIFLSSLDEQSSTMFQFLFKMFSSAPASIPSEGIGAAPRQIAASLPKHLVQITLNTPVLNIQQSKVILPQNQSVSAESVIIATDGCVAAELLNSKISKPKSRGSFCLYFTSPNPPPITKPLLILNGERDGLVNNMFFPSSVSPSYAPTGQILISTTIVEDLHSAATTEQRKEAVLDQMTQWYGSKEVSQWKFLKEYHIPHSQPAQVPPNESFDKNPEIEPGLFVCGDHRNTPTVNGAIASGLRAADAVLKTLDRKKNMVAAV